MFSRRRLHDKYVSWKKLFLQNWTLFRASRIGVVGLAIMIAFLIIALAVPLMGLRDPLYWLAPEADTISVQEWLKLEVGPGSPLSGYNGSVDHAIAFRLDWRSSDARADRIYVPEGPNLFAIRVIDFSRAWQQSCFPFRADGTISVDPVVVNYGDFQGSALANIRLLFGTRSGTVYVMEDEVPNTLCPIPLTRNLGSPITGLAAVSVDQDPRTTTRDGFVVGTEDGRLFRFTVNETSGGFYKEVWNETLNIASPAALHLAGFTIRTITGVPTSSPAFFESNVNQRARTGEFVYAGDENGVLYPVRMTDGRV